MSCKHEFVPINEGPAIPYELYLKKSEEWKDWVICTKCRLILHKSVIRRVFERLLCGFPRVVVLVFMVPSMLMIFGYVFVILNKKWGWIFVFVGICLQFIVIITKKFNQVKEET